MEAWVNHPAMKGGILPSGLKVKRRAPGIYRKLKTRLGASKDPLHVMDWVDLRAT